MAESRRGPLPGHDHLPMSHRGAGEEGVSVQSQLTLVQSRKAPQDLAGRHQLFLTPLPLCEIANQICEIRLRVKQGGLAWDTIQCILVIVHVHVLCNVQLCEGGCEDDGVH